MVPKDLQARSFFDLFIKFHLRRLRPYFQLKHGGNFGRFLLKIMILDIQNILMENERIDSGCKGYWFLILAVKSP